MKIYTKTGDDGTTGLIGLRVRKDDPRVSAYGEVDELNAVLGLVCAEAAGSEAELGALLRDIQRDLFAIGAHLADPQSRVTKSRDKTDISAAGIAELEQAIDAAEATLPPLTAFILPGGARLGATLHLARTVCRRAERTVVTLAAQSPVDPLIVTYLNRLSDLLFVLARRENQRVGSPEDLW
jgi:cob(I)alamin adenosyltransferase